MARGVVSVLSTAWRRRIPWYPGDWIWPALLALAIAAPGAAIAILVHQHNNGESATKTNAALPAQTVPVSPGTGTSGTETLPPATETSTLPTTSVPTTAPTAPAQSPPPTTSGGLTEWPSGQSGWTVILASIPQSSGRGAATREARKAIGAGLNEVGVLNSSEFSSLHSGYYVVFSCVCESVRSAESNLSSVQSSYPRAYTRQITP